MDEDMSVFKSYLRGLMRSLKKLKLALDTGALEEAQEILSQLIDDTQKGIKD